MCVHVHCPFVRSVAAVMLQRANIVCAAPLIMACARRGCGRQDGGKSDESRRLAVCLRLYGRRRCPTTLSATRVTTTRAGALLARAPLGTCTVHPPGCARIYGNNIKPRGYLSQWCPDPGRACCWYATRTRKSTYVSGPDPGYPSDVTKDAHERQGLFCSVPHHSCYQRSTCTKTWQRSEGSSRLKQSISWS